MSGDGIANPNGALWAGATGMYLALVPVTSALTSEGGVVQKAMETLLALIPGSSGLTKERTIPALSALYMFATFAASGAGSVAGQAMSRKDGLDNNSPRMHQNNLVGLPLRLRSAHLNLMENFPNFALAAALTFVAAPNNQQLINLLGLHVMAKLLVFYPCYLLDIAPPRSLAHLTATSAVVNVAYKIAMGAK